MSVPCVPPAKADKFYFGGSVTIETTDKNDPADCIAEFKCIRNSALNGNRDHIVNLIIAYQVGNGTDPDQVKAFEWLLKAVKLDPPIESLYYDIALAYRDGLGTSVDLEEFGRFMEKASEVDKNTEAMFQLAQAYEKGTFGNISLRDSFNWTYKMAEGGDPGAMIVVSRAFKTGRGVIKSPQKFRHWAVEAVKAAENAAELAKKELAEKGPANSEQRNWVKDDLARALAQRAEAEESEKIKYDESDFLGKAAEAAIQFIGDAIAVREECSPDVIKIVVRHVKRLEDKDGNVLPAEALKYFSWIDKVSCAIRGADSNLLDNLSSDLKLLVYKLSCAYKPGNSTVAGIKKNGKKYLEWLNFAVKIGSPDAIYDLALTLEKSNPNHQRYLDEAIKQGNIEAYITKSLDGCNFNSKKCKELFELFRELVEIKNEIKEKHLLTSEYGEYELAHYTDKNALNSMLTVNALTNHNVLRLYNIAYVNDPDEGKRLVKAETDGEPNPLAEIFKDSDPNDPTPWKDIDFFVHIGSFSLVVDKLPLWRAYGRDGNGFCVTIPKLYFSEQHERPLMRGGWERNIADKTIDIPFYRVFYKDSDVKDTLKRLSPILSKIRTAVPAGKQDKVEPLVRMLLSELLYLYKNEEYSSEEEVRVIQRTELSNPLLIRHDSDSRSRLYTETSTIFFEVEGSEIVIGPKVADKAAAMIDIKHNLALHWWDGTCEVSHSKIRYR